MPADYERIDSSESNSRRSLIKLAIVAGIAFLGGLLMMGWVLTKYSSAFGLSAETEAAQISPESAEAIDVLEGELDERDPGTPGAPVGEAPDPAEIEAERATLARRVAQLEERINRVNMQAAGAAGNAGRAEGLLVAFAARRALDRGIALGYIEGLLRERFGDVAPESVARIIAASQQPVTLDGLISRLNELEPALIGGENDTWWRAAQRELSEVFVIRQEGTPSPAPRQRLQRARDKLAVGQVDTALAEVLRLPGRDAAEPWIADARRYVTARNALDRIETIALMDPRVAQRAQEQADVQTQRAAQATQSANEADEE